MAGSLRERYPPRHGHTIRRARLQSGEEFTYQDRAREFLAVFAETANDNTAIWLARELHSGLTEEERASLGFELLDLGPAPAGREQ